MRDLVAESTIPIIKFVNDDLYNFVGGVYLLKMNLSKCLYIGQSGNLLNRITTHYKHMCRYSQLPFVSSVDVLILKSNIDDLQKRLATEEFFIGQVHQDISPWLLTNTHRLGDYKDDIFYNPKQKLWWFDRPSSECIEWNNPVEPECTDLN